METTANTAQDTILEGTKTANKWINDATNSMIEMYKKQLNVATNFYSNFFNLFTDENKNFFNPAKSFTDLFSGNNNGGMKFMANPFTSLGSNGSTSNPFSSMMEKMFKQINEFNQNLAGAFNKQLESGNVDMNAINEKYQRLTESRVEAIKKITNSIVQANNKQMEYAIEVNKNLQEEINNQMNFINKQNQKFWSDVFGSKTTAGGEKLSKDGSASEKKQTKSTVEV